MVQLVINEELESLLPRLERWLVLRGVEVQMLPLAQRASRWELRKKESYVPPKLKGYLQVSDKEQEVLQLVEQGLSTLEIADRLFRSKHTIDTHRKSLLNKFDAKNAVDLINKARELHYL